MNFNFNIGDFIRNRVESPQQTTPTLPNEGTPTSPNANKNTSAINKATSKSGPSVNKATQQQDGLDKKMKSGRKDKPNLNTTVDSGNIETKPDVKGVIKP